MAEADLNGSDGHGISRLPQYTRSIKADGFNGERSRATREARKRCGIPIPPTLMHFLEQVANDLGMANLG